jgi:hypothetical protein
MRDLLQVLREEDRLHAMAVARAWSVDLTGAGRDPLGHLVSAMLDVQRVRAQFGSLPAAEREALARLRRSGGRLPLARFTREFGEIREMGLARRERETPWLSPVSTAEALWYGGWLGRGFAISRGGPEEVVFIPGDLLALMPADTLVAEAGLTLEAYTPAPQQVASSQGTALAEDACTLLAFLRANPQSAAAPEDWRRKEILAKHVLIGPALPLLVRLLQEAGVLRSDGLRPEPKTAAAFLGTSVDDVLLQLVNLWRETSAWNDLLEWGGVQTLGSSWPNDPILARANLLSFLGRIPVGAWVRLDAFVHALQSGDPEFMRPAAAIEGWTFVDRRTGHELSGWDAWGDVEGRFARWLVVSPLFWLGLTEIIGEPQPEAFRLTPVAAKALGLPRQAGVAQGRRLAVALRSEGTLMVPRGTDLTVRYQLARCLSWVGRQGSAFVYRLDPTGLETARRQNLEIRHVISALERSTGRPLPRSLANALEDWQRHGARVVVRSLRVVQFKDAETARLAARVKGMSEITRESLGPQAWVVRAEDMGRLRLVLAESGLLIELEGE